MTSTILVRSETTEVPFAAPFEAFLKLRHTFGADSVYLLESLSGPARDMKSSLIGFGPLLRVVVNGLSVRLEGRHELVQRSQAALHASRLGASDGSSFRMRSEADLWDVLREIQGLFSVPDADAGCFRLGFFGYLGYDVVRAIEQLPAERLPGDETPMLVFTVFQGLLAFDVGGGGSTKIVINHSWAWGPISASGIVQVLARPTEEAPPTCDVPAPRSVRDTITRETYLRKVERCLAYIAAGDIYQVQIGHELDVVSDADPLAVYQRLRSRNPSPYMYFAPFGDVTLVGASPESFIRIENGNICMRPIAGTVRRGATEEEDAVLVSGLREDEKERAEHIMLVDLCRNDVGRVCVPGSLRVDELMVVERYSHVSHLVSNVSAKMRRGVDAYDAIAATFAAGTMTGAPKVRAMEIIAELETTQRGIYAGAVGLIDFGGYVNLALCIRSASCSRGHYHLRASAGVVADSLAENEWRETLKKMGAVFWAVTGEELANEGLAN